ncbi:uncharacterized protein BDCG_04427 [Blastomyces dermatitidis ER-3]|uniref:Uncharacterized protein n=1 Tax=Ajellomyces dermatitidis (strain ER-3 / ATCC MYA-2586) TaxID=559297 RepID=A0ABP2EYJ7_AJEDR|nr:uncharacterized protein BDCG_04427 [Blastomyces dermatitidis ER-3]EEQ89307.1 hypothetical protein BDCG_04427 [Blastomyces dermatitidis ER-3]
MTDGEPTRRRHHQPVSTPSRFDLQEVQQTLTPSCVSYGAHSGERSDSFTHLISLNPAASLAAPANNTSFSTQSGESSMPRFWSVNIVHLGLHLAHHPRKPQRAPKQFPAP